jgi:hypothetical protein
VNYRLAGEFAVSVLPGTTPGFVRVALHKRRDAKFSAAAGFQFDGRGQLQGLPETPNEFLGAFLGTDVQSALQLFDKTVELTDLAQLEKLTGTLFSGVVEDLSAKWLGALLQQANVKAFLAEINKAVKAYKSIDDRIIGTVTALYERLLGAEKDTLEKALHLIKGLNNREELAKVADPKAVELIQLLTGGDIFALMFGDSNVKFAELHHAVTTVLDMAASPDFERLRDVIGAVKERLKLDVLFGQLEKISTPAKLKGWPTRHSRDSWSASWAGRSMRSGRAARAKPSTICTKPSPSSRSSRPRSTNASREPLTSPCRCGSISCMRVPRRTARCSTWKSTCARLPARPCSATRWPAACASCSCVRRETSSG